MGDRAPRSRREQEPQFAIVGDSRIWFDTDLTVWYDMTGRHPVQLGLEGTNGEVVLADLAADERFRGLAVVGMAEVLYFSELPGLRAAAVDYARRQSSAQRFGTYLHRELSRRLAFLDQAYTPQMLLRTLDVPSRAGVVSPRMMPWKLAETFDGRQNFMWDRVERDEAWQNQTKQTWVGMVKFLMPPASDAVIQRVIDDTVRNVQRIRARGGEVAFVRPPSAGGFLEEERRRLPRAHAGID